MPSRNAKSARKKKQKPTQAQVARLKRARAAFLASLEETASVTKTCEVTGTPRRTAYNWRNSDAKFATAWDEAVDRGCDILEDEAVRRAYDGTLKPVFHQGEVCGHIREYSDTLLIFLLKGRRPERYRDRAAVEHTGKDGGPIEVKVTHRIVDPGAN